MKTDTQMPGQNDSISAELPISRKSLRWVFWLLPVIFIIHDGEELLTMPGWIESHQPELDKLARLNEAAAQMIRSMPTTTTELAVAIGVFLLLFVVVTAGAAISRGRGFWLYAYAVLLGVLFLHVFTHLAQAVFIGGYVPGLVGAVMIILPAALYIYKKLFDAKLLTLKTAVITALIGLALFVPGAALAQQIGRVFGKN
jgi:hypothetical protein